MIEDDWEHTNNIELVGESFIHYNTGTKYKILDLHTTMNTKGEIVKCEFLCGLILPNQTVTSLRPIATIRRSLMKMGYKYYRIRRV